jgi:hypothetical protein
VIGLAVEALLRSRKSIDDDARRSQADAAGQPVAVEDDETVALPWIPRQTLVETTGFRTKRTSGSE